MIEKSIESKEMPLPAAAESAANAQTQPNSGQEPQETPDAPAVAPPKRPEMSKGEKWFNRLVYVGMNYWLNLGISLVITDFFLKGRGNKFFTDGVNSATQKLTATGMKRSTAKWVSEIALGTFSLNSGGNILLVPTKLLEDRKRPIVHWLNDRMGVQQIAPDGHKETPDEIYIEQEQPKQSWMRMIGRRFLGWIATTSVGLSLDRVLARKLATPMMVDGELRTHMPGQQVFTEGTVKTVSSVLNSGIVPGGQQFAANPMAQRYMGYAALDWIYTVITSKILHATNGAKKARLPHEIGDEIDPPGIAELDKIEILPEAKAAAKPDVSKPSKSAENYRKLKPVSAPSSYSELVKKDEQNYSLAP